MVLCRSGTRSNTGRTEQRGRRDTARTQAWPLHRHPNHRVPSYVRVEEGKGEIKTTVLKDKSVCPYV